MSAPSFPTFAFVAEHARKRAAASAKRNDPQAWAYWRETELWASIHAHRENVRGTAVVARELLAENERLREEAFADGDPWDYRQAGDAYSRMKWCARILRAHGEKRRLSLLWLHNAEVR